MLSGVGQSHYFVAKKYCRRCECYFITKNIFCQCCGMQLRATPIDTKDKAKIRRRQLLLDSRINNF
jgi:hypothetical protein